MTELRRYTLRDEYEWAHVVTGSDGYFSTCSSYGNYAFLWSHHGRKDFREFLIGARRDPHYFINKLSHGKVYAPEKTLRVVRESILRLRRDWEITAKEAREEWDRTEEHDDLDTEASFVRWLDETRLDDAWEYHQYDHPRDVVDFVGRLMVGKLVPILEKEMAAEAEHQAVVKDMIDWAQRARPLPAPPVAVLGDAKELYEALERFRDVELARLYGTSVGHKNGKYFLALDDYNQIKVRSRDIDVTLPGHWKTKLPETLAALAVGMWLRGDER